MSVAFSYFTPLFFFTTSPTACNRFSLSSSQRSSVMLSTPSTSAHESTALSKCWLAEPRQRSRSASVVSVPQCVKSMMVCCSASAPATDLKATSCPRDCSVKRPFFITKRKASIPAGVRSAKAANLSMFSAASILVSRKPIVSMTLWGFKSCVKSACADSSVSESKSSDVLNGINPERPPTSMLPKVLLPWPVGPTITTVMTFLSNVSFSRFLTT
mmetsp:Transcript_70414/g.116641  ORF Transcript_70414/g.116641 Transcript_70414/m.116641 type:complete len:215 (+) Transcript_70414:401-1045(+)